MSDLSTIVDDCNDRLDIQAFSDYAPNGLQVQGHAKVERIVTGVSASMDLIDRAVALNADALIVHHGYFWRGENSCITGVKRDRLSALLRHEMSLLAYHLPLDAHPILGNNVQLARALGFVEAMPMNLKAPNQFIWSGRAASSYTGASLAAHIEEVLGRKPLHIPSEKVEISKLAWCTGAAQDGLEAAAAAGADAYITGEVSERTVLMARELGIHFYAAGHHATERFGVKALGEKLQKKFGIEHTFIDIDNPV